REVLKISSLRTRPAIARGLLSRLRGAPSDERLSLLVTCVSQEVQRVLRLPTLPDPRLGFTDLGMDSLMAVELRNRLQQQLGSDYPLSATLMFDYPNVNALATFLAHSSPTVSLTPRATTDRHTATDTPHHIGYGWNAIQARVGEFVITAPAESSHVFLIDRVQ